MNEQEIMNEIHDLDKKPKQKKPREERVDEFKLGIKNNSAYVVGFLILLVATLAFFNDFNVQSFASIQKISLLVFFIAFCSYSMYVNFYQKGTKDGKLDNDYLKAKAENEAVSKAFIEKGYMEDLPTYCNAWVEEELKNARMLILKSISITYDTYIKEYVDLDATQIKELDISDKCKSTIIQANALEPLQLSADEIIEVAYSKKNRHNPIGKNPQVIQKWDNVFRLGRTIFTAIGTSLIVLDALVDASFNAYAEALVKLLAIGWHGYTGYKKGYNNMAIYSTSWLNSKTQKINQAEKWIEAKRINNTLQTQDNKVQ